MKRIVWSLLFLLAAGLITLRSPALAQDAEQTRLPCTAITPTESCTASPLKRRCAGPRPPPRSRCSYTVTVEPATAISIRA